MGVGCTHIVPVHEDNYPDAERKAAEILEWFKQRDIVENDPSDCLLSKDKFGYRFKPAIESIVSLSDRPYAEALFKHPPQTFGLDLYAGERTIFHPMEGASLDAACPLCGHFQDNDYVSDFLSGWLDATSDQPRCQGCGTEQHINAYRFEQDWGFSNIGITLWNFPGDQTGEFLDEMRALFGTEAVRVVPVHL